MITSWGYEINELGAILSKEEFDLATAGKYAGDSRTQQMIDAAGAAVRNYCGWHVFPAASCIFRARAHDIRLSYVGSDTVIQLPARYVSAVSSVKIGGTPTNNYSIEVGGLLRIYDCLICSRKTVIEVEYVAGLPAELAGGLKDVVANRAVHGLSQSYGIQSEAAGGVSVSYSSSWMSGGGSSALVDDNRDALSAYRLQGVM